MFSASEHFYSWSKLQRSLARADRATAEALLAETLPRFRATTDDLRLLFYIALQADENAYEAALIHFRIWKLQPPPDYTYRCETFLYTISHSIPPHIMAKKPYIIPRFLETTGFTPSTELH